MAPADQDMPISTLPSLPDFATHQTLYLAFAGVVLLFVIAQRAPVIRSLVNLALTVGLVAMVFMLLNQRSQFDPWLGKIARFLKIEDQQVVGGEVRIRMAPDGHFWARVTIDGTPRRMLIDSGATITAISTRTAADAGVEVTDSVFPVVLQTANGAIPARTGKVGELRLDAIVARGLQVVVSPAFGDTNVLGMNFLSRLASWRVEGSTLILVLHHPQAVEGT